MPADNRLEELFARASELDAAQVDEFLARECAGDAALAEELRALLASDSAAEHTGFWRGSAVEVEASRTPALSDDARAGENIGPYRLIEPVGSGGMGAVYRAVRVDAEYSQAVAIKLIKRGMDTESIVRRFRAERQILANLAHPNIARLLDGGATNDGLPYLVMEYIEGEALNAWCERRRLPVAERLELFRQICSAVHYAHQRMVIHRDLKPGNILVTPSGEPKLLDFGTAKLLAPDEGADGAPATATELHIMTPGYASPEQVRGEPVTTASDIYSLGVILYQLLTGQSPYRRPSAPLHDLMRAVCEEEPERPSTVVARGSAVAPELKRRKLDGDLDNIVLMALRKDPQRRYASADQFSEDVRRYLEGLPVTARGDSFGYVARKFVQRNKMAVGAAAAILATMLAGFVAVSRAEARAERRFNDLRKLAHAVVFDYHDGIENLPGATPVRQRMVKDALEYLDSLSREADDPSLRRELVEAYVRISNVQGNDFHSNLGDTAGALASARKAVAIGEKLIADPTPENRAALASAYAGVADLVWTEGDLAGADAAYRKAVALREAIRRDRPADSTNLLKLAQELREEGDLHGAIGIQNMGRTAEARQFYQRSLAISDALLRRYPGRHDVEREHYECLGSFAGLDSQSGHLAQAEQRDREALALIESISQANPNDAMDRVEVAGTEVRLGSDLISEGKAAEAVSAFEKAGGIMQPLSRQDPKNALFRRNVNVIETQLAKALLREGKPAEALQHAKDALAEIAAVSAATPAAAEYRSDVAASERWIAEAELASGDARASLEHASRSAAILEEVLRTSPDASVSAYLARALTGMGNAQRKMGDYASALESYRKAAGISEKLVAADAQSAPSLTDLATAESNAAECLEHERRWSDAAETWRQALAHWQTLEKRGALRPEHADRPREAEAALVRVAHASTRLKANAAR